MSEPGRRHALSVSDAMSTSKTGRPSSIPVAVGSIAGCEGGAVTGGSVVGSGPSSLASGAGDAVAETRGMVVLGLVKDLEIGVLVTEG
jgi:hypothetical protein